MKESKESEIISPDAPTEGRAGLSRLAWVPIPLLLLIMLVSWAAHPSFRWDSPQLLLAFNFLFSTLVSLIIAYLAARSFLVRGTPGLLLLGAGVVLWGAAGVVGNLAGHTNFNVQIIIHNICVCLSALCHLAGVALSSRSKRIMGRAGLWLGAVYVFALGAVGLVSLSALAGWMPVFFVQDQGGTVVRQLVLGSAIVMFGLTAGLLRAMHRHSWSWFLFWYSLALALVATGLFGVLLPAPRGTLLNWTGRVAQWLGGVYMLIAALEARRESGARGIALNQTLGEARYRYGIAIAVVMVATAVRLTFLPELGSRVAFITFYPAVMLAALYGGFRAGVVATLLSALAADYFWTEPAGSFSISDSIEWVAVTFFIVSCTMICGIISAMHRAQVRAANAEAEARVAAERKIVQAVRAERQRLNDVLETLPAYVVLLSPDYHVPFANRFFRERFGESHGKRCYEYLFNRTEPCEVCDTYKVLKTHAPHRWEWTGPDGRSYDVHDFPFTDSDGSSLILEMGIDITERKRAEAELEKHRHHLEELVRQRTGQLENANAQLQAEITERKQAEREREGFLAQQTALVKASWSILAQRDVPSVLQAICDAARMVTGAKLCATSFGYASGRFTPAAVSRAADIPACPPGINFVMEKGGVYLDLLDKGESLRLTDEQMRRHPRWWGLPESHTPLRGLLGARLVGHDGAVSGTILASHKAEGDFTEADEGALSPLAAIASLALQHIGAAEALREREERLRLALDAAHLGTWDWRLSDGNIVWNDEHCRIFGYAPGTVEPNYQAWASRVHPEDRAATEATFRRCAEQTGEYHGEYRTLWPDGTVRWVEARGRFACDAAGKAARSYGVLADITERKRAEEELHKFNRTLRALSKSNQALMHARVESEYLDAVCKIIVEDCGHAMVWVGYAEEDEARTVRPVAHAGFEEGYLERLKVTWADTERGRGPTGTAIRSGQPSGCSNLLTEPRFKPWRQEAVKRGYSSSMALPLLAAGKSFGAIMIYSRELDPFSEAELRLLTELAGDVANGVTIIRTRLAHARVEEALRESEARLNRAQQIADVGSWEWIMKTGALLWSEQTYRQMGEQPGFTPTHEVFGQRVHPEDRGAYERGIERALAGIAPYDLEFRIVRPDGAVRVLHSRGEVLTGSDGLPRRMLGASIDITERKRTEGHIQASLREKDVLLKEIHHRVKNNLQVISSLVDLQADALGNSALRPVFADLRDRVRSMALVHEKLYQSESLASVDFAEYARSLLNYLWRAHGSPAANIRLRLDLEPVCLSIDQAVPCGLLLNELAANALKHAFRGRPEGQVTIALHSSPEDRVCLRVSDNGVGLPPGLDWRQSRSMGLSLVQMLVRQLNATVEASNSDGTQFAITFAPPKTHSHEKNRHD